MSTTQTDWLRERNNDPYGTPESSPFWRGRAHWARLGAWKIVTLDGITAALDTRHNAWYRFDTREEARAFAIEHVKPADPWT